MVIETFIVSIFFANAAENAISVEYKDNTKQVKNDTIYLFQNSLYP